MTFYNNAKHFSNIKSVCDVLVWIVVKTSTKHDLSGGVSRACSGGGFAPKKNWFFGLWKSYCIKSLKLNFILKLVPPVYFHVKCQSNTVSLNIEMTVNVLHMYGTSCKMKFSIDLLHVLPLCTSENNYCFFLNSLPECFSQNYKPWTWTSVSCTSPLSSRWIQYTHLP